MRKEMEEVAEQEAMNLSDERPHHYTTASMFLITPRAIYIDAAILCLHECHM